MKKIIGIICVAVFACVLTFNSLNKSVNSDLSLKDLVSVNEANAETAWFCRYTGSYFDSCSYDGNSITLCAFGSTSCGF